MIFGDPSTFAIEITSLPGDSYTGKQEGIVRFVVDHRVFPETFFGSAKLDDDLSRLLGKNALTDCVDQEMLFLSDAETAFRIMLGMIYPQLAYPGVKPQEDFCSVDQYLASTYGMEDEACFAFAVGLKSSLRILCACVAERVDNGSRWQAIPALDVFEVILNKSEVHRVINCVATCCRPGAVHHIGRQRTEDRYGLR